MEDEQLQKLKNKNFTQICGILKEFNTKNADLFTFDSFHMNNQWHDLWRAIFDILNNAGYSEYHPLCLNSVRILTRDEFSLQTNYIENELNILLRLAQLNDAIAAVDIISTQSPDQLNDDENDMVLHSQNNRMGQEKADPVNIVIVEALKCICNLVFQSADCRRQCIKCHTLDAVLKRVASGMHQSCAMDFYDMKLLFLLTALEPVARCRLQIDLNGITYMTKWLSDKLIEPFSYGNDEGQLEVMCEVLKVMFNITSSPDKSPNEYEIQNLHLTGVIRELLIRFGGGMENDRERNVITHAINLLTNMSSSCLAELMVKSNESDDNEQHVEKKADIATATRLRVLYFEKRNVRALEVILRYLRLALDQQEIEATSHELLSPVLTVLVKCARSHRIMRHYLRSEILPPLRDVSQRPEVGNSLRNHLCRFLTLPSMIVRDLAAELLFVCCKENVGRMIKYTGYGNAAGLFANRGILDCRRVEHAEYSSDSEDSDTDEYKQQQERINPVLGCYESPKDNRLDCISDEQKEHEAMQLVELIDKLHKGGILQPCRIGEDGKPQPLEHILQLQEELPQQQLEQKRKT